MLKNPFLLYILSFGGVLCAYQLGWSDIYPDLSFGLVAFFCITFFISALFSIVVSRMMQDAKAYDYDQLPKFLFSLLLIGFLADIAYAGGVPLWLIVIGEVYNYADFGIPTLHVAIITLSGAFAVMRFSDYLYSRKCRHLFEALVPLIFDVLIVNRGAVLMTLISFVFVIIIKRGGLGFKRGLIVVFVAASVLYGFGVVGNVRSGGIEEISKPTDAFYDSGVPESYLWTYIYLTSPMANLEETVQKQELEKGGLVRFFSSEILPDFISKRIFSLLDSDRESVMQIAEGLNVSTLFARSYVYFGWLGMMVMFGVLVLFVFGYIAMIVKSHFYMPALALLNTFIVFCIFDNMISFSGMSLQLVWPLVFQVLLSNKFAIKVSGLSELKNVERHE